MGLDPRDWHQLDNFVAAHIVLDGSGKPVAVLLAQHNHHRAYLVRRDIAIPADGRFVYDVALRSNELYLDSNSENPGRRGRGSPKIIVCCTRYSMRLANPSGMEPRGEA